jgi:sugar phosphate permease
VFQALSSRLFYGWVIVWVALLMNIASSPLNAAVFSFFVRPMSEDLGWSLGALAWGFTLRLAVAGISGPLFGVLLDRFGPRLLGAFAGLVAGLCVIGLAFVNSVWAYYALFAVSGLSGFGAPTGQLLTTVPVSQWFHANRGRALAIAAIGLPLGTTIFIPVVQQVIEHLSWRAAWVLTGAIVIGFTTPFCLIFMRKDPESVGLYPDGRKSPLPEARPSQDRGGSVATTEEWSARQALHSRAFWAVLFAVACSSLVLPGTVVYRVSYWEDIGLSSSQVALATALDPLTVTITALLCGLLAERIQTRYLGFIGGVVVAASMMAMVFATNSFLVLLVYNITWGVGMGFNITVTNIVWPNYFGRRNLGTIRGLIFPAAVGASAASAPLFAFLLETFDHAGGVWLVTATGFLIYAVLVLITKPPRQADLAQRWRVGASPRTSGPARDSPHT